MEMEKEQSSRSDFDLKVDYCKAVNLLEMVERYMELLEVSSDPVNSIAYREIVEILLVNVEEIEFPIGGESETIKQTRMKADALVRITSYHAREKEKIK